MNRLTKRTKNCPLPVLVRDRAFGPAYFISEEDYTDYRDALEKLARCEDSGLEPEEVEACYVGSKSEVRNQALKFMLDGCDISFIAEAPNDITLEQLLKQTDKIKPDWCACGIRSLRKSEQNFPVEIVIGYSEIRKADETAPCQIKEGGTDDGN